MRDRLEQVIDTEACADAGSHRERRTMDELTRAVRDALGSWPPEPAEPQRADAAAKL